MSGKRKLLEMGGAILEEDVTDDGIRMSVVRGGESVSVSKMDPHATMTPVPEFHVYDGCYFFWAPGEEKPTWYRVEDGKIYVVATAWELPPDRKVVFPTAEEFAMFGR